MKRSRRHRNSVATALYVNAAVLAAILGVLLARDSGAPLLPAALAQAQPAGIAGGAGIFLMPAQFSGNIWGCYIMDVDQQTLCAYTVSGSPPQLKLVAARDFRHDRRLRSINTTPSPQEVQEMVAKEAAAGRVLDRPDAPAPSPEQPAPSR